MKKIVLILAVTIAMICSAGCVSTSNNIIGTWTCANITDFPAQNVTQVVIIFDSDKKGTDIWTYNNGGRYVSNMSWIKNEDGSYAYAYDSWQTTISEGGSMACDDEGRVFVREEGDTGCGYVGTWTTIREYEYNGILYTITNKIYADHTGVSIWTDHNGGTERPWEIIWYPHDEDTCINYYKEALVSFTILNDGTGIDNYNLTYTKT